MPARDDGPPMAIRLSRRAWQDLEEIRRYTAKTWGREQWLRYYRGLVRVFDDIAEHPDGGRDRSLFAVGLRSVSYERHVVFFARITAAANEPVILRIVHQRRNLPALSYFEDIDG